MADSLRCGSRNIGAGFSITFDGGAMTEQDMQNYFNTGLEHKFAPLNFENGVNDAPVIKGYASLFGIADQNNDVVVKGAYAASLAQRKSAGCSIKMLWQHDPAQPIGVWEEVREDEKGLFVSGYLLPEITKGAEAAKLLRAGALDGLSIGYRTKKSTRSKNGQRLLNEIDLWEVSLVTFPMLPEARIGNKTTDTAPIFADLAQSIQGARQIFAQKCIHPFNEKDPNDDTR